MEDPARTGRASAVMAAVAVAAAVALAHQVVHAEAPASKTVYTLKELIQRALATSPELRQVQRGTEVALAKKDQADAARFPQIELTAVVGPSPRARGTVEDGSPDRKDSPVIDNVFERIEARLIQPLYTFGKITGFREAAAEGVKVDQAKVEEKASELILRIKELYYGRLLASDILDLIDETDRDLTKAIEKTERQLRAEAPGVDEVDLYKLRAFRGELLKNRHEAQKGFDLATTALRTFSGLDVTQPFQLDADGLDATPRPVEPEDQAIGTALDLRPEMAQVRAGLKATEALVQAEESNLYPHFFFAVEAFYAQAGNRTRQQNPFVYDPINDRFVAVLLGLRYNLDFGITRGKIRAAQAEHFKVQETKQFAEQGIPLQVRKAHREIAEALETIRVTEDGWRNARKWLVAANANFDLGVGEARDLGEAAETYIKLRAEHFRAIHNYHIAVANLEHVTGRAVKEEMK
jgi:outer membrane protein